MHRIDHSSAVNVMPSPSPLGTPGYFTGGNPISGQLATVVTPDWANSVQEEIANAIERAGQTLNKTDNTQLYTALLAIAAQAGQEIPMPFLPLGGGTMNPGSAIVLGAAPAAPMHAANRQWVEGEVARQIALIPPSVDPALYVPRAGNVAITGPLSIAGVISTNNVYEFAGANSGVSIAWDGANLVPSKSLYTYGNITATANIAAVGNVFYFGGIGSGVYLSWDGGSVATAHTLSSGGNVVAAGTLYAGGYGGTGELRANVWRFQNLDAYFTWNGAMYTNQNMSAAGYVQAAYFNAVSHSRHKRNIRPCEDDSLALILKTPIKRWEWNDAVLPRERSCVGFVADDTDERLAPEHEFNDLANSIGHLMRAVQQLAERLPA